MQSTITVAAYAYPPYVNPCFTKYPAKCLNPGTDILMLHNQLRSFGFRIRLIEVNSEQHMRQTVKNGSADIGGTTVYIEDQTALQDPQLLLSMPAYEDNPIIFLRKGLTYSPNLLFNFCPFYVWFFILACLIISGLFESLYPIMKNSFTQKLQIYNNDIYVRQFPLLCWSLAFGVFLSIYSQYLGLTLNTRAHEGPPFTDTDTLLRLLYSKKCKLNVQESFISKTIELGDFLPLGSFIKEDLLKIDVILEKDFDDVFKKMLHEDGCNVAMSLRSEFLYHWQSNDMEMHEFNELPKYRMAYIFRKNLTKQYPMINYLNMGSAHSRYFMLHEKMGNKQKRQLFHSMEKTSTICPLSMEQLKGGFWLLLGGLVTSCLTFTLVHLTRKIECKIKSIFQVTYSRRISVTVDVL